MTDVFTKEKRSEIMARIQAKNTKLERGFLKELSSISNKEGYRYRKHYKGLIGKPDLAFPAKRIAVFVDGCFWHSCPLHARIPRTNVSYWNKRLQRNSSRRDREVNRIAKKAGWRVIRLWENEVKKRPVWAVSKIMRALRK